MRRMEGITEALWSGRVSSATISELNKKAYVPIKDWRNRLLWGRKYPYVYAAAFICAGTGTENMKTWP